MVVEIALYATALTALAGWLDLRTTEVADEIPAMLIAVPLFYWYLHWGITGDAFPLFVSLATGTLLLAVGLALYRAGQWGGADAWLLAGVAYALPVFGGRLFITDYIFNFFIVTIVYMLLYAVALGIAHRRVWSAFAKDLQSSWKYVAAIALGYGAFVAAAASFGYYSGALLTAFLLVLLLAVFWRYARVIEKTLFRKRIATSQLREGDVTGEKWVGITEEEVKSLRASKKYVTVKEGVRFVPVFPIALAVTLLWGNVFFLIF